MGFSGYVCRLAAERIGADMGPASGPIRDETHLGEMVYANRTSSRRVAQVTVVGVAGLVGSAILVPQIGSVEAFLKNGPLAQLLMLSVIATFGLPAGLYMGLIASRRVTYFHQRGLRQTGLGQPKVIPYDQVESVAFKSTRVFVNGIYSITRQKLRLRLADGRTKRLRHACKEVLRPAAGDGPPVELQKGAMAIAAVLAERMRGELDAGRMVHWTKDLDLYPDGLQLHSTGRRFPCAGLPRSTCTKACSACAWSDRASLSG